MDGHKLQTPPTIDGILDAEWDEVPSGEGMVDAANGGSDGRKCKFWLAYDSSAIYFAARMEEPDPKMIKANEYRTNVRMEGDDIIALIVDPFGRTGGYNIFRMNPRGGTWLSIAGGRAAKREWLGEISAKGRVTESGWEAEARIPWGIMRLPSPGVRELSFNVFRYDPRLQRDLVWAYSPNSDEGFGRWTGVDVPRSGNQRSLKMLPYVYGGYDEDTGHVANAGLDLKTSLSDQIDLVGSINPDFRNIENQILSLDFSRFERLAGESRPFFLEGAEVFRTSGDSPLFASQRIKSFDAGFKTFGKVTDRTQFGVMDTADFGNKNAFMGIVSHQVNTKLEVKGAVASLEEPGVSNLGTFLQANYAMGPWFFFGQNMFTRDSALGDARKHDWGFGYNGQGLNAVLEYYHVSEGFLPRIGFAPERNFKGPAMFMEYVKPVKTGPLMEWGFGMFGLDYQTIDGNPYRRSISANTSLTFRDRTDLDFGTEFERFFGVDDHRYFISLERPRGDPYRRWQLDYMWGRVADHDFRLASGTFLYRPVKELQLSLSLQSIEHFEKSTQAILGFNYDLTEDTSFSGRAVRRDNDVNFYLAYRKAGNKGMEHYLILGDPNAPRFRFALVAKVVVPVELKF